MACSKGWAQDETILEGCWAILNFPRNQEGYCCDSYFDCFPAKLKEDFTLLHSREEAILLTLIIRFHSYGKG